MAAATNPYKRQLAEVHRAIDEISRGGSGTLNGKTYGTADLPALTDQAQLLSVRAAILAIESGAQSYSVGESTFTKADLRTLHQREETLLARMTQRTRGGIRMRFGVPRG